MASLHKLICAIAALVAASAALADYPDKPIRIIVPYTPGGGTDTIARVVGQQLAIQLGQPVVMENKPGAGGAVGTAYAAKAPADGYTLLIATSATTMFPALYRNPGFALSEFTPLGLVANSDFLFVVSESLPARNIAELIALAKARPEALSYGSAGIGSVNHITMEMFASMAGVQLLHVPYKGTAAAVADLVGGQLSMMMDTGVAAGAFVKEGKLRLVGTTGEKRTAGFANTPTVAEQGLKDYSASVWYGFVVPKGTPEAVVARLNAEINKAVAAPAVRDRFGPLGAEPYTGTVGDFRALLATEETKWAKAIRSAKIRLE